jgi:hypothetical protein
MDSPRTRPSRATARTAIPPRTAARWQRRVVSIGLLTAMIALVGVALVETMVRRSSTPDPSGPLRWAPPVLVRPRVVRVPAAGGVLRLADGQDYLVELPELVHGVGGVVLLGGRNVIIMGGHLTVAGAPAGASPEQRRALYLKGQTGTVHVEGLLIDDSGGDLSEGINIAAPQAVVQIVNCRIEGIHARDQVGFSDNHPDLIQPWGGVRELRVDRLTGSSDYQGITLEPDYGPIGPVRLSNVNLVGLPTARYLFWQGDAAVPVALEQVWLVPGRGRSLIGSVWPDGEGRPRAVAAADGSASWPGSAISGVIRPGRPPGGDFVPAGNVGTGYTSPGYQTSGPP